MRDLGDVFMRIASRHDRRCEQISVFAHWYWKSTMARQIARNRGSAVMDVAVWNGDIANPVAREAR